MICESSSGSVTEEAPAEEIAEEEIAEEDASEEVEEEIDEAEEEDLITPSSDKELVYEGRYISKFQGATDSEGDLVLYIFVDGSATAKWRKDDTTFWQQVSGKHFNNNSFDLKVNENVSLKGSFDESFAEGCTKRNDGSDSGTSLCFDAERVR